MINDLKYIISDDWSSVKNSTWTEEENKIGIDFIKYRCRAAMEISRDPKPAPFFYATIAKKGITFIKHSKKWFTTRRDEDEIRCEFKIGQRVKAVMFSRFGDIGITDNLEAENGYICRIHPFEDTLTNISLEP